MKREYTEAEINALKREAAQFDGVPLSTLTSVPSHPGYQMTPAILDELVKLVISQRAYPEGSAAVAWLRHVAHVLREYGY
jgi:hypothetical protein